MTDVGRQNFGQSTFLEGHSLDDNVDHKMRRLKRYVRLDMNARLHLNRDGAEGGHT